MKTEPYQAYFYANRYQQTVQAAGRILDLVLPRLPPVRSALDVGCGVGAWLSVLREKGVADVLGVDGAWVDEKLLKIPVEKFRRADLSRPLNLERRFDLAICLEVAEHLPPERADGFIAELAGAADFVLFSAAIPFQGGYGHVNEQWPSYWAGRFAARGYAVRDWVRPRLWTDVSIPVWYRENLLLFVAERRLAELAPAPDGAADGPMPLDLVHPEAYRSKVDPDSWRLGLAVFRRALKKRRKQ
jgi:SAM-dependent methyltransferase